MNRRTEIAIRIGDVLRALPESTHMIEYWADKQTTIPHLESLHTRQMTIPRASWLRSWLEILREIDLTLIQVNAVGAFKREQK